MPRSHQHPCLGGHGTGHIDSCRWILDANHAAALRAEIEASLLRPDPELRRAAVQAGAQEPVLQILVREAAADVPRLGHLVMERAALAQSDTETTKASTVEEVEAKQLAEVFSGVVLKPLNTNRPALSAAPASLECLFTNQTTSKKEM